MKKNLRAGVRGVVVHCHGNNTYKIEFTDNDMDLKDWVTEQTKSIDKAKFEKIHLIPNVGLELSDFKEYIEKKERTVNGKIKENIELRA